MLSAITYLRALGQHLTRRFGLNQNEQQLDRLMKRQPPHSNNPRVTLLEILHLPSYWSQRYDPTVIVEKFIEKTTEISNRVTEEVPGDFDNDYSPEDRDRFDLFGIDLQEDAPIFIYVHGGYYTEENVTKENSRYAAGSLYKNGWKTAVIGYTLCPQRTIKEIHTYVQRAIRDLLHYAIEKGSKGVCLGGHSVGVTIAMSIFNDLYDKSFSDKERDMLKAIVCISGLYDLSAILDTYLNDVYRLNEDDCKKLSPIHKEYQYYKDKIKFYVYVGKNDAPVFVEQAKSIGTLVFKMQIPDSVFKVIPDIDHFEIVEKLDEEDFEITQAIIHSID